MASEGMRKLWCLAHSYSVSGKIPLGEHIISSFTRYIVDKNNVPVASPEQIAALVAESTGAWLIKSGAYTAVAGDRIQADTTSSAFTITLPAAANVGDSIQIEDSALNWNTNNLTIARNGLKTNGGTSDYTASVQGNKLSIVYISASYGWSIK